MALWQGKFEGSAKNQDTKEADVKWLKETTIEIVKDPAELERLLLDRFGSLQSALSCGTTVEGRLTFDKPVQIDGELKGEIVAPDTVVVIGKNGKVDAKVEASLLVVLGEMKGSIKAVHCVEVLAGAHVTAEIDTPELVIAKGCVFNGTCTMPEQQDEQDLTESDADKTNDNGGKWQKALSNGGDSSNKDYEKDELPVSSKHNNKPESSVTVRPSR